MEFARRQLEKTGWKDGRKRLYIDGMVTLNTLWSVQGVG